MASNIYGVAAYQQTNQTWKKSDAKGEKTEKAKASEAKNVDRKDTASDVKDSKEVEMKAWKPVDEKSSLVPVQKDGYGMVIGDVELSDEAKDYYQKLRTKFSNSEFILVSKDMKSLVAQNASAYANPDKLVVLIDEEKIERMAKDPDYRDKYEAIIAMAELQMEKNGKSIQSAGARVKNFGMTMDPRGNLKYFAVLEKSSQAQKERIEKKAEEKAEEKIKEKKRAEKEEKEKRLEEAKEEKEYVQIEADSFEELLRKIQKYAYANSENNVRTEEEKAVGQHFDFRG